MSCHLRSLAVPLILVIADSASAAHTQGASNSRKAVPGSVFSGPAPMRQFTAHRTFPVGTRATASQVGNLVQPFR
jgi:hypothetical protein